MIYSTHGVGEITCNSKWHWNNTLFIRNAAAFLSRMFALLSSWFHGKQMGANENNTTCQSREYKNIAPTAALVAYYRAFSDIPYAKEISVAINAAQVSS